MIIYEFSEWGAWKSENGLFSITEIEVEEKPKSYIGKHKRISKSDIDVLQGSYGNKMYRLTSDAKPYIDAIIARKKTRIEHLQDSIKSQKAELEKWELLQRKDGAE